VQRKTFKFRIYPNKQHDALLWKSLQQCRMLYNELLEIRSDMWHEFRLFLNKNDTINYIKINNKKGILHSQVAQNVAARVDRSFQNFFEKRAKYPKFRKTYSYSSFTYPQSGFKFVSSKRIKLSMIGEVKIKKSREVLGTMKSCTVKRTKSGKWYVCIQCELADHEYFEEPEYSNNNAVGLDIGIKSFASLSDGTVISNPRHLLNSEKKLKREQRRLSRKRKGSRNRIKQIKKLARIHEKVANQRSDFHYQTSHWLVNHYDLVAVEDLSPQFMIKNHRLAKHASDVGITQFFNILEYEAHKHQTVGVYVKPYNTSQMCSSCHKIVSKELSERTHRCHYCGFVCDRDINAAINILEGIPDEYKQTHTLLRDGTAGLVGTHTPVETVIPG